MRRSAYRGPLRETCSVYESDPDQLPDSEFTPGDLSLLHPGNVGRMLDPRRTPIRIIDVMPEIGMFELEVAGFEDSGTRWILDLEAFRKFQFAKDSARSSDREVTALEHSISRFSKPLVIEADDDARAASEGILASERDAASDWLGNHTDVLRASVEVEPPMLVGSEVLRLGLLDYLDSRGLGDIERSVTQTWVSNPRSGEIVKAHEIIIAELGLAPFEGMVLRDGRSMSDPWGRRRRKEHVLVRVGFVRSMFELLGIKRVPLYRGLTFEHAPTERRRPTLISTTFSRAVADALVSADPERYAASLLRQPVPTDRIFMSYIETEAFNSKYTEAEAVLFTEPQGILF